MTDLAKIRLSLGYGPDVDRLYDMVDAIRGRNPSSIDEDRFAEVWPQYVDDFERLLDGYPGLFRCVIGLGRNQNGIWIDFLLPEHEVDAPMALTRLLNVIGHTNVDVRPI